MHDRYRVNLRSPFSPPGTPVGLLRPLAAALNSLNAPVTEALEALTHDMVEVAFNSITPNERQRLLRGLGIRLAAPRRASKALCLDVLTRMRRVSREEGCSCSVQTLTGRVIQDVAALISGDSVAGAADPVTRWGAGLVRLAVFAWCQASVADARIFVWVAGQDWLGFDNDPGLDNVRAAAVAVIEATPDFDTPDESLQLSLDEPSLADQAPPAPTSAQSASNEIGGGQEAPDAPEPLEGAATEHISAVHAALIVAHQAACDAAKRVTQTLADGRPPEQDDLHPLVDLPAAFDDLQRALSGAGLGSVPSRLEELSQAVAAHQESSDLDRSDREILRRLITLTCTAADATAQAVEVAQARARQLLDTPVWTDSAREQAEALKALVEIVDLRDLPDAFSEIMLRQQRISLTLPECQAAAVMFQQLSFAASTGPDTPLHGPDTTYAVGAHARGSSGVEPHQRQERTSPPRADSGMRPGPALSGTASVLPSHGPGKEAVRTVVRVPEARREPIREAIAAPHSRAVDRVASAEVPDQVESALCRLVDEGRFGLASHLSHAAGRPDVEAAVFRLAAAGASLHSASVAETRFFADVLQQLDALDLSDAEGAETLLAATLIRAALVTGESSAGAQLRTLASHLPAGLGEAAVAVADRALSGALLIAPPMSVITDVSESESRLREVTQSCRDLLKPPRLRYNRATLIAKRWLAADGMLGALLQGVTDSQQTPSTEVRETVSRLSRLSEVHTEIDRADRELRGPSGNSLQGPGRQDLVHLVERAVNCWKAWRQLSEGLKRSSAADNDWAVQEISAMRKILLAGRSRVITELEMTSRRGTPLAAANACSARELLASLFNELQNGAPAQPKHERPQTETDCQLAINAELLKLPLSPGGHAGVSALISAVDQTWEEALALQEKADAFGVVSQILDLAEQGLLPGLGRETVTLDAARRERARAAEALRREELAAQQRELVVALRHAQADGALTEDQDVSLQELLDQADPAAENGTCDLGTVRRKLDQVAELLPQYREEAAGRLRARLEALPEVTDDERAQVLRHLDTDGLATASDLVYFLELGEPVPEITTSGSHLSDFFPAVPNGLPDGITAELINMIGDRKTHPTLLALDYSDLSADEARRAADALRSWHELAVQGNRDLNVREKLLPALKLLGYEGKRAHLLHELPRSGEYQFADVLDIEVNGRAWVPAFGSKILERGGRLRVLMLWGKPSVKLLLSRIAHDPSADSLLVAYFGTLSHRARTELAAGSVGGVPLMVVDDAVLAYLAAHGNRQASTTNELLLPFSGVNPYIKEKRGRIGREMFYGRDAERKKILDPDGTQIIFGGRGLGKSALLNDAGDRFVEQQPGNHHKLYVNLDHHNIGKGSVLGADTIWQVLERELTEKNVLSRPRRRETESDPYERVRSGIAEWLAGDTQRRLLVLMDECDQFFESDVPRCTETRRLRGLCESSSGRVKVVFAGLHSVQRFTRLARNGPFGHLAQTPTVVGPLAPQFAADLLVLPTRALGFEFADVDLVNRVLGYCSYQPFLLQMFGSRLVEVMQRKRARGGWEELPLAIESADVEEVESNASLRADITAAFKETLALDDRYSIIANVLARQARDNGLETRMSDAELRDECASWWREGFDELDSEGFRAYLQEMVGLGVLAPNHDGRGWHLRGPSALRMIGTAQEVETRLLRAEDECKLEQETILEGCPQLSDKRPASLTVTQINDILGEHANQVRVVLGTPATDIESVEETLRDVAERFNGWNLPAIGRPQVFRQELTNGKPGERRAVISNLARRRTSEAACREALDTARNCLPDQPGVTRSAVLVMGLDQLPLWQELIEAPDTAICAKVILRRHDRRSLRSWTQNSELFRSEQRLTQLLEVTGGWPMLLKRAVTLSMECQSEDAALQTLRNELQQKSHAAGLVAATGLTADPLVEVAFKSVVEEFGTEWTDEGDILAAIELAGLDERDAQWALMCAETLQIIGRNGGRLSAEAVLADCWSRT